MTKNSIEKYLTSLKGSEGGYPFGPEALVFKVMGKMFALVTQQEKPARVTLKCIPDDGSFLVSQYESIIPGYHMNKKHWITITLTKELTDKMIKQIAEDSYKLVVNKLSKAEKKKLESQ